MVTMSDNWKRVTRDLLTKLEEVEAALRAEPGPEEVVELISKKISIERRLRIMLKVGAGILGEVPEYEKVIPEEPETRLGGI